MTTLQWIAVGAASGLAGLIVLGLMIWRAKEADADDLTAAEFAATKAPVHAWEPGDEPPEQKYEKFKKPERSVEAILTDATQHKRMNDEEIPF